jgi:hypothetical protein
MYVLQFFVANKLDMCPKYSKSHFLKTILLYSALENYILLIYMYIMYAVINKNKLT